MSYVSRNVPRPWSPLEPRRDGMMIWPAVIAVGLAVMLLVIAGTSREGAYAGVVVEGSVP